MSFREEEERETFQRQILPYLREKVSGSNDIVEVKKVQLSLIGSDEAFMLTICYRARVVLRVGEKDEEFFFVVKKTPLVPPEIYASIGFAALFTNEIATYKTIIPAVEKFTGENFVVPKYIYSEQRPNSAVIILEDFKVNGWEVCSQRYNLSLEHILLAVHYLGEFHGKGFAMKLKEGENFQSLVKSLTESRYLNADIHPDFAVQLKTGNKRLKNVVEKYYPEIEEKFLNELIDLISDTVAYGKARVHPNEPLATICHGDFLRNNLAVKYDELRQPIDIMMFDLQTMRYSSPMIDLSVLLGLSAFQEVRHQHFEEIFDKYCCSLRSAYEKFTEGTLPEYLSHDSLLKEYIGFLPYSIHITGFFLMNLVEPRLINSEDMLNVQRTDEEIEEDGLTRGGETVDRELAHQVYELYTLSRKYEVDFKQGLEHLLRKK